MFGVRSGVVWAADGTCAISPGFRRNRIQSTYVLGDPISNLIGANGSPFLWPAANTVLRDLDTDLNMDRPYPRLRFETGAVWEADGACAISSGFRMNRGQAAYVLGRPIAALIAAKDSPDFGRLPSRGAWSWEARRNGAFIRMIRGRLGVRDSAMMSRKQRPSARANGGPVSNPNRS